MRQKVEKSLSVHYQERICHSVKISLPQPTPFFVIRTFMIRLSNICTEHQMSKSIFLRVILFFLCLSTYFFQARPKYLLECFTNSINEKKSNAFAVKMQLKRLYLLRPKALFTRLIQGLR